MDLVVGLVEVALRRRVIRQAADQPLIERPLGALLVGEPPGLHPPGLKLTPAQPTGPDRPIVDQHVIRIQHIDIVVERVALPQVRPSERGEDEVLGPAPGDLCRDHGEDRVSAVGPGLGQLGADRVQVRLTTSTIRCWTFSSGIVSALTKASRNRVDRVSPASNSPRFSNSSSVGAVRANYQPCVNREGGSLDAAQNDLALVGQQTHACEAMSLEVGSARCECPVEQPLVELDPRDHIAVSRLVDRRDRTSQLLAARAEDRHVANRGASVEDVPNTDAVQSAYCSRTDSVATGFIPQEGLAVDQRDAQARLAAKIAIVETAGPAPTTARS